MMSRDRLNFFYLLMLAAHVAHVFEEVWGRFWIMDAVFGPGWFLVVNWLLFCIPVAFFYFALRERRWAYRMSVLYAGFMVLNGIVHNAALMLTGRYFGGFAGAYTGIAFILIGPPLIYYLRKGLAGGLPAGGDSD
jgi:hypothetical protein